MVWASNTRQGWKNLPCNSSSLRENGIWHTQGNKALSNTHYRHLKCWSQTPAIVDSAKTFPSQQPIPELKALKQGGNREDTLGEWGSPRGCPTPSTLCDELRKKENKASKVCGRHISSGSDTVVFGKARARVASCAVMGDMVLHCNWMQSQSVRGKCGPEDSKYKNAIYTSVEGEKKGH